MKKLVVTLIAGLAMLTQLAQGCDDEACLKEQAAKEHNMHFPSYLTWKYCDGVKNDFITTDMQTLQSYSEDHFETQYKGPIKATIQFIADRKDWLGECDQYLSYTGKGRIFDDDKTTEAVFAQMDKVTQELQGIIGGVSYSSSNGSDQTKQIVGEKFKKLFQIVDDHKTLMHLKGRYVLN